jgi:hypothetical protein
MRRIHQQGWQILSGWHSETLDVSRTRSAWANTSQQPRRTRALARRSFTSLRHLRKSSNLHDLNHGGMQIFSGSSVSSSAESGPYTCYSCVNLSGSIMDAASPTTSSLPFPLFQQLLTARGKHLSSKLCLRPRAWISNVEKRGCQALLGLQILLDP